MSLRPGTYFDSEQLRQAARAAVRLSGLKHAEVGARLGVSSGAISLALAPSKQTSRDGTLRRIVELLTPTRFSGPYWRAELPPIDLGDLTATSTADDEDDGDDDDGEEESADGRTDG